MPINFSQLTQFTQNCGRFYSRQYQPLLRRTGLSMREVQVLLFLSNHPTYDTARDISQLRGMSKSQVSQAVELLAAQGILSRTPDRGDRRVVHLAITPQGRPLAQELVQLQQESSQRLLACLSDQERREFRRLMDAVMCQAARLAEEEGC